MSFLFDNTLEGFDFNKVPPQAPYVNLAIPGDAGVAGPAPSLDWSGSVDSNATSTNKGSMKITATFSDWDQQIEVERFAFIDINGAPLDLSNKILRAKVRLERGLWPSAHMPVSCMPGECGPGGCVLYLKTNSDFDWGQGTWQDLTSWGNWIDIVFDIGNPDPQGLSADYDPLSGYRFGILFFSGSGLGMGEFGGPLPSAIYVDNVTLESKP